MAMDRTIDMELLGTTSAVVNHICIAVHELHVWLLLWWILLCVLVWYSIV